MDSLPGMLGLSPSSSKEDKKAFLKQTISQQNNVENATILIKQINEKCFEKCVPKPGSSLSSGETTCLSQCMQKYMGAWNTVSASYIQRIKNDPSSN